MTELFQNQSQDIYCTFLFVPYAWNEFNTRKKKSHWFIS